MGFRYSVRPATPDDCRDIIRLIKVHAEFEGANIERDVKITELQLKEDCFGDGAWSYLLVVDAFKDDDTSRANTEPTIVGIAMYYFAYGSWVGRLVYLEELYIEPLHRGEGLGKSVIRQIAQIGVEKGCNGIQGIVRENNVNAQEFCARLGAIDEGAWKYMYIRGENARKIPSLDLTKYKSNIQVL